MLAKIQALFSGPDEPVAKSHGLELAAAALLVEVSAADFELQAAEAKTIVSALQKVFDLDVAEADELMALAADTAEAATSMYEFTKVLNEHCSHLEKNYLLEQLWRVAFADGHIDKYEDHRIRRIADLLYLSHGDFIRAKLRAEEQR